MPQESRARRRSLGYRGFLSCEDPRGVAESGTIRKPKISPTHKQEHGKEVESDRRKHKMEIEEECQSPTSFHLLEVSRGAQKLSNVINSWSSGHSKSNSKDLAQDLLEGALDLGESLAMLSKFQHSPTKKHLKHWFDDDLEIEEMDFVEDMKKVIRNGRKLDAYDAPSTSSSQSSFAHSASNKKNKKMKRPNLIAKLMGLEDSSLRSLPLNPRKHIGQGEKNVKQKKPLLDPQQFQLEQRWNGGADKSDDRPPIVILRPSRFSCLNLEQPIIPKTRGEVFEEIFLGMNIRTNPLAQTDECKHVKSLKKQFVEKKVKGTKKSGSHFQAQDRSKGTKKSGSSKKSLSKNNAKAVNNTDTVANGNQRYRAVSPDSSRVIEDASQIEITVADYADDDQSSPSETPVLFCSTTDMSAIQGRNEFFKDKKQLYSVCDHLVNGNHSCTDSDKLRALLSSSRPFIKHMEEHFHEKARPDSDSLQEVNFIIDHGEINAKELLDTVIELISLHVSKCSKIHKRRSLENLLEEVCDEIKALRRYATAEGENLSTNNNLVLLVKGDLRTTGIVGGMWDVGWTSTGSADELQELSREVVELILDGLIEEISL